MEILDIPNNNTNLTGDPDEVLWAKTKSNFEELTLTVSGVGSDAVDAQADVDALASFNSTVGGTTMVTNTYKKLVSLTSANILAMNGAPVVVLAAPGEGKAIVVKNCVFIFDSTGTAYANGGVVYLSYNNTTPITNNAAATLITGGDKVYQLNSLAAAGGINTLVNTAVTVTNDTAPFITGTGVARLLIEYDVVTTGL